MYTRPASLQKSDVLGAHLPGENTGLGSPSWGLNHLLLGKTSAVAIALLFVGCLTRSGAEGLDCTLCPPFLWFLLNILRCGKSFLPVFRLFS